MAEQKIRIGYEESWFKRHPGWTLFFVIIILGIISGIIGGIKTTNKIANNFPSANNITEAGGGSEYLECSTNKDCSSSEECQNNKCIKTVQADTLGHSRSKPASINTLLTIHFGYSWSQIVDAEITLLNVKRGDSAWASIKETNMFNEAPKDGKEYLLAKFRVKILKTSDDKSYSLNSYSFDAVSENGVVYDKPYVVVPDPQLSADLYSGAIKEGWAAFEIDKSDSNPLISFNREGGGDDSLWFGLE